MSSEAAGPEHDRWADSVASYLLGALPEHERDDFERHLDACAVCADEAEMLRVATDALPASPHQLVAPPEIKDRLMAVVNAEAQLLRAAGPEADVAVRPERRGMWSWLSLRPRTAVLATAGVLAAGALGGVLVGSLLDDSGVGAQRTVLADVEVPGASAKLIVREDHSTLVAQRLPAPGKGRVYQVWLQREGGGPPEATDALFGVRNDGSASVDVPGSLRDVDAVLVTSEPDGGSPAPTRAPILSAQPA